MISINIKSTQNFFCVAAFLASPVLAGEKSHLSRKTNVEIDIREWNLTLNKGKIRAGKVNISAVNKGEEAHELVLIKLNEGMMMDAGRFPVGKHGEIDEGNMPFGKMVGEIEGITPGSKVNTELDLQPGKYAVICNMLEQEPDGSMEAHYSMGMHTLLEVE